MGNKTVRVRIIENGQIVEISEKLLETAEQLIKMSKPIVEISSEGLANTLVNRFKGFKRLDQKQGNQLGKLWAVIAFKKPMKMRKYHSTEKGADGKKLRNPFWDFENDEAKVFEVGKLQVEFNAIWQNKVANVRNRVGGVDTGWKPDEVRSNGIENYCKSRVVCFHPNYEGRFYLNYIVSKYLEETTYVNENGEPVNYDDVAEYHSTKSEESKQKEADKHGLTIEDDVQIRQIKFDNIRYLRIFGLEYRIIDEIIVQATAEQTANSLA